MKALSETCPAFKAATKEVLDSLKDRPDDCSDWNSEDARNANLIELEKHLDRMLAAANHSNKLIEQHMADGYCDVCRPPATVPTVSGEKDV